MRLGFIGAGKMATAIAKGAVSAGICTPVELTGSGRSAETRERFEAETGGGTTTSDNDAVFIRSEIVFLCVKPADACATLRRHAPAIRECPFVVSVAAGVALADLQAAAGPDVAVVRSMPNTPCLVGKGATAYARGASVTDAQAAEVERVFAAVGDVHAVPENLIDAVNGLSGSGPAYVYLVIEALADGGVLMGLPRKLAASLAAQTVLGAAASVQGTGRHPAELREAVASPGGTTMAALESLERAGARAAFIGAVRAATERARELGR